MMNRIIILAGCFFGLLVTIKAQNVGITDAGSSFTPDASSVMELKSTTRGLLIPRMTMAQRNLISSPLASLLIYQSDNTPGFYFYNGSSYITLLSGTTGWAVTGNAGTTAGTNYFGTSDAIDAVFKANGAEELRLISGGAVKISGAYTLPIADGTTSYLLKTNGAGAVSFGQASLTASVSGILPIANGGTNSTATATAGGLSYGTGTAFAFTAAGTAGQYLISGGAGAPTWGNITATAWGITGNAGTTVGTNFVGTTDAKDLVFKTNSTERMRLVNSSGNLYLSSGAAASVTSYAVGRTAEEFRLAISANPDNFAVGSVAGDGVIRVDDNTKKIHLVSGVGNAVLTVSSARVGIGTVNPATTLEVQGPVTIGNATAGGSIYMPRYNNPTLQLVTDQDLRYENMLLNAWANSSNPGITIGTTRTDGVAFNVVNNVSLTSGLPSSAGTVLMNVNGNGDADIDNSTFHVDATNNRVGIGQSTPGTTGAAEFEIKGAVSSLAGPHIQVTTTADAYPLFQQLNWSHDYMSICYDCYYDGSWKSSNSAANFRFFKVGGTLNLGAGFGNAAGAALAMNDRMNFTSTETTINGSEENSVNFRVGCISDYNSFFVDGTNNRVGIGTAGPAGRFHIYEATGTAPTANTGTILIEHGNSGGISSVVFKSKVNAGSDYGYISYVDDKLYGGASNERSLLTFGTQNDGAGSNEDDIALMPSGYVGINTISPTAMLSVNGTANNPTASWGTFSDIRLKKDINDYKDGLAALLKIHTVKFRYNAKSPFTDTLTENIGVIAQEIQKIAPYTVTPVKMKLNPKDSAKTDILSYNPGALTYLTINAVQEQQTIISNLQIENKDLKNHIIELTERLEKVENFINNTKKDTIKK